MNATLPAAEMRTPSIPAGHMADLAVEHLPISSIRPSTTALQALRRARFNPEKMLELADNILHVGVLQPILVRELAPLMRGDHPEHLYEIIAGERRWIAAHRAGLAHIPAIVRNLGAGQIIEAQLTENIQRDDYSPMEEGEGYHELMVAENIDLAAVGRRIGRSKSYVHARVRLRGVCAEGRQALQNGTLDASKALLIARVGPEKLQAKAVMVAATSDWSYKRFAQWLKQELTVPLDAAPFALVDDMLLRRHGSKTRGKDLPIVACSQCPHNSANDPELTEQFDGAHVCTDKPCYDAKVISFHQRTRAKAISDGREIVTGEKAAKLIPNQYQSGIRGAHLDLDAPCEEAAFPEPEPTQGKDESDEAFDERLREWEAREEAWSPPTYRTLLGDTAPQGTLAEGKHGKLHELVPLESVRKALKAQGIKLPQQQRALGGMAEVDPEDWAKDQAQRQAEMAREAERRQVEMLYRERLLRAVHGKWKGALKVPDLQRLADFVWGGYGFPNVMVEIFGENPDFDRLKEPELIRFLALAMVSPDCDDAHGKPGRLLELCQRFQIDAKKIRADVVKELKPVSVQPEDDAKPAPKKTTKKKGKK